jgi:tetratricopeptide (TPR) repeat protein
VGDIPQEVCVTQSVQDSAPSSFATRLRARRAELGLSQSDVAGEELHPSYVSLLESGKRTPTSDVAAVLAARLSCTPEYLLRGDDPKVTANVTLAVSYAEIALRNGEAADALTQTEKVLAEYQNIPAHLRARAETVRAQALEGVGRIEEAIVVFEGLAAQAAKDGAWSEHLQRIVDVARCYQQAGDVAYSLEIANEALDRVQNLGLAGTDAHAQLASTIVGDYYVRGDFTKAGHVAADALHAIEANGSSRARGSVLWNASLVSQAKGDIEDALLLAERSLALFADGDDARATARLRVAYAWLLLRTTPPQAAEARKLLTKAHRALRDVGTVNDLAGCETELAVAAILLDEPEKALTLVDEAAARYGPDAVSLTTAGITLVRARALMSLRRRAQAEKAYRSAAATLGQLDVSREAASAWRELADAYLQLGLLEDAALAYQQALSEAGIKPAPGVGPAHTSSGARAPSRPTRAARR